MSADENKTETTTPEVTEETKEPAAAPEIERPAEVEEIEEEIEIVEEKFYTVNLRDVWNAPRKKRAPKAVKTLRDFVKRNMKVDNIKVSDEINKEIWTRSLQKPPRRVRIRAVKDKEGQVTIFPVKAASTRAKT